MRGKQKKFSSITQPSECLPDSVTHYLKIQMQIKSPQDISLLQIEVSDKH